MFAQSDWTAFTPESVCVPVPGLDTINKKELTFKANSTPPQDVILTFNASGCVVGSPYNYQIVLGANENQVAVIRYEGIAQKIIA